MDGERDKEREGEVGLIRAMNSEKGKKGRRERETENGGEGAVK